MRASTVRLPPSVHGLGDHGFVPTIISAARRSESAGFVGDGADRWPAVHRHDAARLFRLAMEKAATGSSLRGVAEEGVPMRDFAQAIGAGLGIPVRSVSEDEAATHFDWMARFVAIDNPMSSAIIRNALGWTPMGPSLLTGLRDSEYFA